MMQFEPSLFVTRMVIKSNSLIVYDKLFHQGLNIIRGENASGKSTILNFIFYGLGGDLSEWSDAALQCTQVLIEAELSGKPITLSREVSQKHGQPMNVFGGPYDLAQKAPSSDWMRYPYKRSQNRESFSQMLFRLLGLPEVRNELSGNVTIHQVLRLLYADQLSPIDELFRHERFDSALLRDAVGRLLCGAYDGSLYENELNLRKFDKELDIVSGELRGLFSVFGQNKESLTLSSIDAERTRILTEQINNQNEVEKEHKKLFQNPDMDQASQVAQETAYNEVQRLQKELLELKTRRDANIFEMTDSERFIASLEEKLAALGDASLVAEEIGNTQFRFCPSCYTPLEDAHDEKNCHLCKSPFDPERYKRRIVAQINEMEIQVQQSRMLQGERTKKLEKLDHTLGDLEGYWRTASARLRELSRLPSFQIQERLQLLQRQAGYLDRQLEDLEQRKKTVDLLNKLSEKKEKLSEEIDRLRGKISTIRETQKYRFDTAKNEISKQIIGFLHNDISREEAFEISKDVEFDFAANRIKVDEQSYFSASSRAYLKASFAAGFLFAAAKDKQFRHPRFCIIDIVEDKGMEMERTRNLQIQLSKKSEVAESQHQLIFATSMIAPELENAKYTVGPFSTREKRALKLPAQKSI
ncbi:AAA family ATPase [Acetobacter tropicalis]|uniref:Rad50/SbcC-type AAA domain-containing protein n=1 Tax=Acetobacter tropicalis TaxID=104102 RepID=A0A251ZYS9_9PROT|nr:AAA family ATPase [Acetobacter tropicalis]OUI79804.1 hypothetical protein HC62_00220 [Acetobacter tropicalis]